MALVIKNLPANAGDIRDTGSIPGSGRSLGGGHGYPIQYSCLENLMNSRKKQKDTTLKDGLPGSKGIQYATGKSRGQLLIAP